MSLLPPKGPYTISTLTLELPRSGKFTKNFIKSPFRFRGGDQSDIFELETVLVTLFYPTSISDGQKPAKGNPHSWLNEPRLKTVEGLLKYGNLSTYLTYPAIFFLPFSTKLPYGSDGPLAEQSPTLIQSNNDQEDQSQQSTSSSNVPPSAKPNSNLFPVGVFSHGLAGSRTTYSSYLANLASHGMIIASVEHRDGSAPYTQIRKRDVEEESKILNKDKLYRKFDELDFDNERKECENTVWEMRKWQLQLRKVEVLEALEILHKINDGQGDELANQTTRPIDNEQIRLSQWKSKLDLKDVWGLGHSFGGATMIELLREKSAPFIHAVVLDPWLEPIAKVNECEPIQRPLYVINSEGFTTWRKHFAWLRALVNESKEQTGKGWLITLTKTKHTDFSDFPFLMPRFFKPAIGVQAPQASETLSVFSLASRLQFVNQFTKSSELGMTLRDERPGEVEERDLGQGGFVVWHPLKGAPTAAL